jgi:uncharacterized protein (DUF2249 family)
MGNDNDQAAAAIVRHHAQLQATLHEDVDAVVAAVAAGRSPEAARRTLLDFLKTELLPHARAEETTLYIVPEQSRASLLVAAMLAEHTVLGRRIDQLAATTDGLSTALEARAIEALFEVHLEKENERLLPFLVADRSVSLVERLAGMHELLGPATTPDDDRGGDHGPAGATSILDVRPLAPIERHQRIFATFDALEPGAAFVLVNDHDPKPLGYQFAAEHAGHYSWDYLEQGPTTWRVRIGRTAPEDASEALLPERAGAR